MNVLISSIIGIFYNTGQNLYHLDTSIITLHEAAMIPANLQVQVWKEFWDAQIKDAVGKLSSSSDSIHLESLSKGTA